MKFNTIANLLLACSVAFAADVNYNVIAFPKEHKGTTVGLVLDGKVIPMTKQFEGTKWTVQAATPTNSFHYAILSSSNQIVEEEEFTRKWDTTGNSSDNYIYGKLNNNLKDEEIKKVPRAFERLSNEDHFSKLFQEGQVKVIHLIGDPAAISNLHSSPKLAKVGSKSDTPVEMYIAGNDNVKHFTNVTLSFSGMGSRGHAKRPYKIKLSDGPNDTKENKSIHGRKAFKLRNLVYDCTYAKQKIVTDLGHAMGVILPQVGFARLYINEEPYGLYELTDNPKKNWIKKVIHEDALPADQKIGSYYKGVSYSDGGFRAASLNVETDEKWYKILYECENEAVGQDEYTDIKNFIQWVDTINENTSVDEIKSKFEVDLFLKYMVIEYLVGQWDGYWIGGNNFYLYSNPVTKKYLFMSFDFDITLGKWDPCEPDTPYTQWGDKSKEFSPALVKKILYHPKIKKTFEEYLTTTVKKTFNKPALSPRIEYLRDFLQSDIAWDKTLTFTAYTTKKEKVISLEDSLKAYETSACEAEYGVIEWVQLRSEGVAKQFGFTISEKVDTSLGVVGNRIVKEKDGLTSEDGTGSKLKKGEKSSAETLSYSSFLSAITLLVIVLLI